MKFIKKIEIRDGILIGIYGDKLKVSLEDAKQMVKERLEFQKGKDYPVIVHLNGIQTTCKEARTYMAKEGIQGISIGAFVVNSFLEKTILNFFLRMDKPPIPAKAFTSEEDAIKWINEYK